MARRLCWLLASHPWVGLLTWACLLANDQLISVKELINPSKLRGVFYGWWLVGAGALIMALTGVPIFQGMPTWFVVLERRFAWNRAQLALAFSFTRVEGSVMGPVGGYLTDKLGPRRMVLIGLLIMGLGFLLFSVIQNLWQFYLAFIVMSVGSGLGGWLPMMTALNNWFSRRRTLAMAIAMNGFNVGGVLFIPLLAWAIDPDEFDLDRWRVIARGIGITTMAIAFPVSRFVRNRPEDYGYLPDGRVPASDRDRAAAATGTATEPGYTWQEALRARTFWLTSMGAACTAVVIGTLMVHLGPMLTIDRDLSLKTLGLVLSTYTGVAAVFTFVGGYIGDRVPIRYALFVFSMIQSAAVIIVLFAHNALTAFVFAVVFGIGFGARTPMSAAVRGSYFGRRAFASIMGLSQVPMNLMMIVLPLFAGIMREITGKYDIPFYTLAAVSVIGSFCFLFLGEPPRMESPGEQKSDG